MIWLPILLFWHLKYIFIIWVFLFPQYLFWEVIFLPIFVHEIGHIFGIFLLKANFLGFEKSYRSFSVIYSTNLKTKAIIISSLGPFFSFLSFLVFSTTWFGLTSFFLFWINILPQSDDGKIIWS